VTPKLKLESLERLGWRFGLETIRALLAELQNPHLPLRFIHVAGSNGKGSTCAFMASFLKHAGYKTGLYTSPHLSDIRERFRINGSWIPNVDFKKHTHRVLDACLRVKKKLGHTPTHFEALTAIAFSWFKEQKVDWVVLEVGLGGRLDATNIIPRPMVALITPVSLEHRDILGQTIGKIAREKAGILKFGCLAATIQHDPEASRVIDQVAAKNGVKLWVGGRDFRFKKEKRGFRWEGPGFCESLSIPGLVEYQITNAALALAGILCLQTQGVVADQGLIQRSLGATRWPGRMEVLGRQPFILMDGAHNPGAAQMLLQSLKNGYPEKRWIVLNGFLRDKDYGSFARVMKPVAEISIVTEPPSERKEEGTRVFGAWEKAGVPTFLVGDWQKALGLALAKSKASSTGLLITGSFYLGGACRKVLMGSRGLGKI
jgi:dihydrofolate synthase / folylpolyglutamate synthase